MYKGRVIAAREWGEKMERMRVPPAVEGSWDSLIHEQSNGNNNLLMFKDDNNKTENIERLFNDEIRSKRRRGQRAIGVVYNPAYERYGNYVPTLITKRYDAFLHIDETHALHPLHMPETKEDNDKDLRDFSYWIIVIDFSEICYNFCYEQESINNRLYLHIQI
jgi:erythromycin esterase